MQKGTVKHYKSDKGYGFIKGDDGIEVFFHVSALDKNVWGEVPNPTQDQVVTYRVVDGERGPKAVDVVPADAVANQDVAAEVDYDVDAE